MSVAFFIVLDSDETDFDAFVDGKMLTAAIDEMNAIARDLGVKQFEDYAFQDLSEFGGPDTEPVWFDAEEGITWATALVERVRAKPDGIPNVAAVIDDLEDYLRVFREADKRGLKWHLEMDF